MISFEPLYQGRTIIGRSVRLLGRRGRVCGGRSRRWLFNLPPPPYDRSPRTQPCAEKPVDHQPAQPGSRAAPAWFPPVASWPTARDRFW